MGNSASGPQGPCYDKGNNSPVMHRKRVLIFAKRILQTNLLIIDNKRTLMIIFMNVIMNRKFSNNNIYGNGNQWPMMVHSRWSCSVSRWTHQVVLAG